MTTSSTRPNIIYMHSHDTGRYIQPYGYRVRTPNLQRFAEQGVLFRQAFCVNPTCSPSRASLLTGGYPHQNGMLGLAHRGFQLHDYKQHLLHTLRAAGYTSTLCGVQHISSGHSGGPRAIGYDQILDTPDGKGLYISATASKFLRQAPAQPFFMSIGFGETHRNFPKEVDRDDDPRYIRPPAIFPDQPDTRLDFARFATMAHTLDDCMGQVLHTLDQAGLADNTLVIITTDHGIAFPDMKCNLTDHGTGVMLMMRSGQSLPFTGGKVVDHMVSHIDVFPTICDVLGIDRPAWLMGESLLPAVESDQPIHDDLFTTVNAHAAVEPMRAVRTERYKLIRRYDGRGRPVRPNVDDSLTKTVWLNAGWYEKGIDDTMLFDLLLDPMERRNVAGRPDYSEALGDMTRRLEKHMRDSNDPLLKGAGAIPWPGNARLNDPDGGSPGEKPVALK